MTSRRDDRFDVAVIGAGIIGLACARALDARGVRVVVIERGQVGREASWAAAGMLAPLAEVPESGPMLDACRRSRDLWQDFAWSLQQATGIDLDYDRAGALALALDGDEDTTELARLEASATALGEPVERLDRQALRSLVPDVAPAVVGALRLTGEHRVDNRRVCQALVRDLERRRVRVEAGRSVRRVDRASQGVAAVGDGWRFEAERLLVTAGAWAGTIDGVPALPVVPVHGEMLRIEGVAWPWSGSLRASHLYAVRRSGDQLLIGATMADHGFDDRTTEAGQGQLDAFVARAFPGVAHRPVAARWSGLRPGTPDGLPVVGTLDDDRLWWAGGHFRNGILLAPWTAEILVHQMLDGVPGDEVFGPRRFVGDAIDGVSGPSSSPVVSGSA